MSFSNHTLILKNDSTLYGCGHNDSGQLGLGNTTNKNIFIQVTANTNYIKSVYCGQSHTIILKNDNTLWACGNNQYGQLGLGDTNSRDTFTQITTNVNNIKSIYCGAHHTLILKNDGTLWGCGWNYHGQLGLGDGTDRTTFTQITTNTNNIKSIYCANGHTIILKNNGTLWACGYNDWGQLGLGNTTNRTIFTQITANTNDVKSVYCGNSFTFILKNDGTLWGCGYNQDGRLGLGDTNNRNTFMQITTNADDIKSIHCGSRHTFILKNDGTLWGCGYNEYGQLGLGDTNNRKTFTIIGSNPGNIKSIYCSYDRTLILKNDGTLWGCGDNSCGQLGLGDTKNRTIFTIIGINTNYIKCFANDYSFSSTIKIYDSKIGYTETLDTNNFRNIPIDKFEKLKVLCTKPLSTILNCIVSFDKKQTWKTFDGLNWSVVSDISESNIIMNCMDIGVLNTLNKSKLVAGGFTGDLDFKIAMKTNDKTVTSSVTKIYIEYK